VEQRPTKKEKGNPALKGRNPCLTISPFQGWVSLRSTRELEAPATFAPNCSLGRRHEGKNGALSLRQHHVVAAIPVGRLYPSTARLFFFESVLSRMGALIKKLQLLRSALSDPQGRCYNMMSPFQGLWSGGHVRRALPYATDFIAF